jgi:hypothetical protein
MISLRASSTSGELWTIICIGREFADPFPKESLQDVKSSNLSTGNLCGKPQCIVGQWSAVACRLVRTVSCTFQEIGVVVCGGLCGGAKRKIK